MNRCFAKPIAALAALTLLTGATPALACAACYGKSDSPLAAGMNAGIFALLAVVGVVLSGVAGFGVYLVKRSAAVAAEEARTLSAGASKEV